MAPLINELALVNVVVVIVVVGVATVFATHSVDDGIKGAGAGAGADAHIVEDEMIWMGGCMDGARCRSEVGGAAMLFSVTVNNN